METTRKRRERRNDGDAGDDGTGLEVGLCNCVYLWSASTSRVTKLCDLGPDDTVTSVSWTQRGAHLAVGTNKGEAGRIGASLRFFPLNKNTGVVKYKAGSAFRSLSNQLLVGSSMNQPGVQVFK